MDIIERNRNKMETGERLEEQFPFQAVYKTILGYFAGEILSHWHAELELIIVETGEMDYIGESSEFTLHRGEGVLVNSNILHSYKKREGQDCRYLVVRFSPELVSLREDVRLYKKYVQPYIAGNRTFMDLKLSSDVLWQKEFMALMKETYAPPEQNAEGWELEVQLILLKGWQQLYHQFLRYREVQPDREIGNERIHMAVEFIKEHVEDRIRLSDIAAACNISNTECCRVFKQRIGQSPMEYVTKYRIRRSTAYLEEPELSIMQVAGLVGFESQSYYTKVFGSIMGCTPKEYRKQLD